MRGYVPESGRPIEMWGFYSDEAESRRVLEEGRSNPRFVLPEDLYHLRGDAISKLFTQGSGSWKSRTRPTEAQGLTQVHQEPSMRPSRLSLRAQHKVMPGRLLEGSGESQTTEWAHKHHDRANANRILKLGPYAYATSILTH